MQRNKLILIDAGPVLKLLELKLEPYEAILSGEDLELFLSDFCEWLRACAWAPLLEDPTDGDRCRNITIFCVDGPACPTSDFSEGYWRNEKYPPYKAKRKLKSDLYKQIARLMLANLPFLGVPRFEADDMIALMVRKFNQKPDWLHAYILTADSDLMALVDDGVTWLGIRADLERQREPDQCYRC